MSTRRVLGGAIRAIRERSNITPAEFAETVGISVPHLANIELGHKQPSAEVRERMRRRLDVPLQAISYLLPDTAVPRPRRRDPNAATSSEVAATMADVPTAAGAA